MIRLDGSPGAVHYPLRVNLLWGRGQMLRIGKGPIFAFLLSWIGPGSVVGAENDCTTSNWTHTSSGSKREFRIASLNTGSLDGVTSTEFFRAAIAAAETWNEHSNHGWYRYDGATTLTDIPTNKSGTGGCDAQGVDFSIVVVGLDGAVMGPTFTSAAHAQGRCWNGSAYEQFYIRIFVKNTNVSNDPFEWDVGAIAAGKRDLLGTLTHEVGHTQRLGHIEDDQGDAKYGAIMGRSFLGHHYRSHPFRWDYDCLDAAGNDHRDGNAVIHVVSGGTVGAAQSISTGWTYAKVSPGYTVESGVVYPSAIFKKEGTTTTWTWTRGINSSNSDDIASMSYKDGAGATDSLVQEHSETRQILINVPRAGHPADFDDYEKHRPKWVASTDEFNTESTADMSACTNFGSGFLNCTSTTPVYTGLPVAVAYHDSLDATVWAWVNHNRTGNAADHKINVAAGYANVTGRVGRAYQLSPVSLAAPGLACKNNSAGTYDCIVGYVDLNASDYQVKVKRFSVSTGSQSYVISEDASTYNVSTAKSANRIAVFYHNNTWWLALKRMEYFDYIYVYTSTSGTSWTNSVILSQAITGPSSVGWRTADNLIGYVK